MACRGASTPSYTSAITVARVGHGRTFSTGAHLYRADRFNVEKYLNRSANRVITPTSGTATYSASSSFGGFPASNAADGNIATDWAANGAADTPTYWQVAWSVAQDINLVMIRGRTDAFGAGYIEFSDGSRIGVQNIGNSQWVPVDFPDKNTTSLRVASVRNRGANRDCSRSRLIWRPDLRLRSPIGRGSRLVRGVERFEARAIGCIPKAVAGDTPERGKA